ncbi:MAG TPA: cytochrome c [Candidatus Acidoferrales bacterium]|nr:cytochrome c [Candidatus Acidoferrales bacterium]
MRNLSAWLLVGFVVLALTVPSVVVAGSNVEAGKAVYDKKCATCHGKEGEGKEAIAKTMKVELRHLGSADVQGKSDDQLKKESIEGTGKMKPVKGLSDEDVANLMAYLRTLKQK